MTLHAPTNPPVAPGSPRGGLSTTFSSLQFREFRLLWSGVTLASAGQWMEQVGLSWVAYDITGDPIVLGLVNGFKAAPALLSGPFGGVAADRMERKMLMMVSQLMVFAPALSLGILLYTNAVEVWHLYTYAAITGLAWSFNNPVRQSLLPELVPRTHLTNAIALQSAAFQMARLVGPAIAGMVIGVLGPGAAFLIKAFIFLLVLLVTWLMKVPAHTGPPITESVFTSLREGLGYIRSEKTILSLILLALIPQMFAQPYFTLLPVFAKDVLHVGPEGFGLLVTLPGIGALAATLVIASLTTFRRRGRVMLLAAVGFGLLIVALSLTSLLPAEGAFIAGSLAYAAAALVLALIGSCQMSYNTLTNTLLQTLAADHMRGRVMSIYILDQGLTPLGTMWGGYLASIPSLGAPGAYAVMGFSVVALTLMVVLRFPHVRRL